MGFTFKFYKHKHLFRLKEKWKDIGAHVLYCSSEEAVEREEKKNLGEDAVLRSSPCKGDGDITYPEIINTIQYSSICMSIFSKQNEVEGIVSLDYELCAGCSFGKKAHNGVIVPLGDLYHAVSLHIKEHSVLSSLSTNNSLIINLVISKNVDYLDDLCSYVFYTFEDIVFILLFLQKKKKEKNEEYFSCEKMGRCIHIDVKHHLKMEDLPYDRIVLFCRYSYANKIYLRPTSSSDVYDLHELLRRYTQQSGGDENHYLIYNLIETKTEEDILLSILNHKKKIIGFVWLKKNIDVNVLVRLYNLKAYNYLLRREFFQDIAPSLVPFSGGTKNLNKKKKKYLFIQFKQFILSQISVECEADLDKKHEIDADVIYGYLRDHLTEDVEEYAAYFAKKDLDTRVILRNIYNKLQYDYENCAQDPDKGSVNFALMNKLINLCAHLSHSDISKVSTKFQSHFDKVEMLYFNFNTDKTYKKIYDKVWRKKGGIKTDEGGEHDAKKINIIKLNCDNSGTSKSGKSSKEVVNLSYFDIFLLLENIYPEIFKKNEIILLFLFLDLYELITVEESTPFDCVSFKLYLDELVDIKKNYFICKYKHIDWLSSLSDKDKNAFSLNLFILNDKYHHHCKDVLLKIEKYYDEVDYVVATNNERGRIPLILNYFNRVKKKKKTNTLESLYVLNKYTLFLPPCTDYMRMTDIEDVQKLLEAVEDKEKEPINAVILSLKEFHRRGVGQGEEAPSELKFYRSQNYYIFVTRCGGKAINVTAGRILNNIDFYYKLKAFDFKDVILRNENREEKHFLLSFFLSIIIFKFYDKRIVHNILGMTKACSCQIAVGDNTYSDVYKHFKFLFTKDNSVSVFKKEPPMGVEASHNHVGSYRQKNEHKKRFYLVMTKQMCLKKFTNIDHNIVFWGINDVCLSMLYKLLTNNEYFFNNIIIVSPYRNRLLEGTTSVAAEEKDDYNCNSIRNCSLENLEMYRKLSDLMIKQRVRIIHDNIFNIDRENKKIELNNSQFIFYDYLFICFDKEDISTYSFQLNSYEVGKKKNFNFIERNKSSVCPNERFDFLTKAKDYEKFESSEWPAKERSVERGTPRRGKYRLNRGKRQHVDSPTLRGIRSGLGERSGGKDAVTNMQHPGGGDDPSSSSDSSEGNITGVVSKGMLHGGRKNGGTEHHEQRGKLTGGKNPTGQSGKADDEEEEEYHSDYSTLSSSCIQTSETSQSEGEAKGGGALEMVDTNDDATDQQGGNTTKRGHPVKGALHRESLTGVAALSKAAVNKGELLREGVSGRVATLSQLSEGKKAESKMDEAGKADKMDNSDETRKTKTIRAAACPSAERKNVEGLFSISDPFLDKYFDKNSTYMTVVKNCVSYIVIYSDNMDILTVVNFFLRNGVNSYKLLIISPHTCAKCSEKNPKNDLREEISKHRLYYQHKEHLKKNYIISDEPLQKNSYHKNCVPDNVKHVLNKVFVLFHFLKIRIIQGEIIAIKKSKQNRLKHVVVRFCKHGKVDPTLLSAQRFLFKNTVLIPCRVLLCSYVFNISNHLHYVLNKASIVYNDRICVNHNFQTNDKFIFSAGELCAFSSKYRIGKENILNHEQYNGSEIGNLVSKRFLSLIIENAHMVCDFSGSKKSVRSAHQGGKNSLTGASTNGAYLQRGERCQDEDKYHRGDTDNPLDLYRTLKVFEKPIIHFSCLPCDFYFYHFQAPTGDLCKFHNPCALGKGSVGGLGNVNPTNSNVTEATNSKNVYNEAFLTDTLKICVRRDIQLSERFKVKHFEIASNISTEGYYCRVTTNSLNLINSFTYLGRQKLNFHNLHKLCNMSINYFYAILKNIKTSPNYDILSLLSEEREKSIFHYKFQMFREKLKTKLMHLPSLKESLHTQLQGVNDAESFRQYVRERLFLEDGPMTDMIKEKVETHLIEYIKENHELLNGYYLPG
ncbi:hypothetical protein C922_03539 [Plasmodium inui San Antonio 1]|uniref:Cilia- and flagella-associated protein 61 N-terminal domain-containing protein n=1 Tax=Plasmodium inui San Antonio 1 TaxID=1237626 RepID=W7AAF1_9APIC|nr:hypothetical protein C922_03539 [Plasmodium inui San Antonio 1]EUD66069.1 hypothetical protein C922_03539 [Plasmodium inui San Antonio 1]